MHLRTLPFLLLFPFLLTAVEPVPVLPEGGLEALRVHNPPGLASRELVAADHPFFQKALRVRVENVPEQVHQIQINQRNAIPIPQGSTLRIRAVLRSASPGQTPLSLHLFVQDAAQGFRSLFDRDLAIGGEWESVSFTFPVTEDFEPDRMQFSIFLGARIQVIELGAFIVDIVDPEDAHRLQPDLKREISVQGEYLPVRSSKSGITGSLPVGWEEDSSWADVAVHYRPQLNNPYTGDRSLRAEVANVTDGAVQFRIPSVPVVPSHLIRMRIPLRSEDNRSVSLTLRKRDAPYTSYWHTNLPARPEWALVEVLAIVKAADPDASLIFSMNTPGTIEIGDFELEYLTPDQALSSTDFSGNLLPSSSFPLGLSAPWARGANGTTSEHLAADPSTPGPSGLPALRLTPHRYEGRPMIQITSPFTGKPAAVHTFSFWAKSEKPGMNVSIRLGPPSAQLYLGDWQKSIALGTEWKRYEHSVLLPPAPDMLNLARITSHDTGTFWIDQAMVEVADAASDFMPAGPVEVHAVADRDFGLSFEDEPLSYRLALTGDLARAARIHGTVLDLYGNETELPGIDVPAGSDTPHLIDTQLPPLTQLGSFLVTHQALDADNTPLGKPAELLLHRVRKPRHWGELAFDSPFGTHVHNTDHNLRMAKALGFNWNRGMYTYNWNSLQKADGSWNFTKSDQGIARHTDNDLLILTHLGGVPRDKSAINQQWDDVYSWYRMTSAPRMDAMDGFEEYAYQLLSHAGDSLQGVETWNEPFLAGFFVGDVQDGRPVREKPEVLLEMNRRVRSAADRANYSGRLLWNTGPHYGPSEKEFTRSVRDLGGTELVDGLTFHRYTNANLGFPGDRFSEDIAILEDVFRDKPALQHLWNSEGGHGLSEIFNLYRRVLPNQRPRTDMQAVQYVRYFLSNFAAGVEKVFIYTLYIQDSWIPNYGYMNVDGVLSQIAPVTSNLAWQLEGKKFTEQRALSDTVYAQHYRGETENTVVYLPNGRGIARLELLPEGVRIADVYGNAPELPHDFSGGLLYLSAPGLQLEQAEQILSATEIAQLPVFALPPEASPDTEVPSSTKPGPLEHPAFPWIIGLVGVFIFLKIVRSSKR